MRRQRRFGLIVVLREGLYESVGLKKVGGLEVELGRWGGGGEGEEDGVYGSRTVRE